MKRIRACVATADYSSKTAKHLSFRAGETFAVLGRHSERLYRARHKGRLGLVPVDHVRIVAEPRDGSNSPRDRREQSEESDYDVADSSSEIRSDGSSTR